MMKVQDVYIVLNSKFVKATNESHHFPLLPMCVKKKDGNGKREYTYIRTYLRFSWNGEAKYASFERCDIEPCIMDIPK